MHLQDLIVGCCLAALVFTVPLVSCDAQTPSPRMLPGELSADDILNGAYPYPPSPARPASDDWSGFARERLSPVPAPGVHPRILLSPGDLPGLRRRLRETDTGRQLFASLLQRTDSALRDSRSWASTLYDVMAAGDVAGATALVREHHGFPADIGHYQPWFEAITFEAFAAMVNEDPARGKKSAMALTTWAQMVRPGVDAAVAAPLGDDITRSRVAYAQPESLAGSGGHVLGYAYDFAYNFMSTQQRDIVRSLIAKDTAGRLWMGARLPHHFRNWNWIAVWLQRPLLALAIEGEPGYDPRVYKLGTQIARDYLTYGISDKGFSTEAVGYTQFGLVWGNPFFVAAARRGDNMLVQNHLRSMVDWYLNSMEPFGEAWTSHGDGGDTGPSLQTMQIWKYFYPDDPKIDFVWQNTVHAAGKNQIPAPTHIIEPLIFAADGLKDEKGKPVEYAAGARLNEPLSLFDPHRGSMLARSAWSADAMMVEFECRTDSVGASHEHADRAAFTFSALGRSWAKDNFRSVETKFHNSILIDGVGQGYWPGPGAWLELRDDGKLLIASADAKPAYDWFWPKEILTEKPDFARYKFLRWADFGKDAAQFQADDPNLKFERDTRPAVVEHWKGFERGDPRMWDEDAWPVRAVHNPVQRAFRSIVFKRGSHPFLVVVDDIQKDDHERLYEWLMQTGPNTEIASMNSTDVVLSDEAEQHDANGMPSLAPGTRELLVRVLDIGNPSRARDYSSRPATRLETFDRKDTLVAEMKAGALSGSRSYNEDKRLVIASRSVAPNFKILLFPMRRGDPLPTTTWDAEKTVLTIKAGGDETVLHLVRDSAGRTHLQ